MPTRDFSAPLEPGNESENACTALLMHVLEDHDRLLARLAPDGLAASPLAEIAGDGPDRERGLYLLGNVLWEVFSQNHDVVSAAGTVYHLGSWRGSGDAIADVINDRFLHEPNHFDYVDFYSGLRRPHDERLRPFYVYVFERLHQRGCTWRYAPPSVGVLGFDSAGNPQTPSPATAPLLQVLQRVNAKAARNAVIHPPVIVQAYRDVYGTLPPYVEPT